MHIDAQSISLFFLSSVVGVGAWILRRMVASIDKLELKVGQLCTALAVTKEWREGHERQHEELRQLRGTQHDEVWGAIDKIREKS